MRNTDLTKMSALYESNVLEKNYLIEQILTVIAQNPSVINENFWDKIKQGAGKIWDQAKQYAPAAGAALGTMIGGPAGTAIGGQLGTALAGTGSQKQQSGAPAGGAGILPTQGQGGAGFLDQIKGMLQNLDPNMLQQLLASITGGGKANAAPAAG